MIAEIWSHDYKDLRLIFEQSDELHYFYIRAKTQKIAAKMLTLSLLGLLFVISALLIHNSVLVLRYGRLEASNIEAQQKKQEAIEALETLSSSDHVEGKNLSQDQLLNMAKIYQDKLKKTKLLVQYSSHELVQANKALESGLKAAGISRSDLGKVLQDKQPAGRGGPSKELWPGSDKDLSTYKDGLLENQNIKDFINALPSTNPVSAAFITSKFGPRIHPVTGKLTMHEGLDFVPSFDQNAKTVLPGIIESAEYDPAGYGKVVLVSHPHGIKTLYGHLDSIYVAKGQKVEAGTVLGKIGNTGLSTGKHLHFEILVNDTKVNPSIVMEMAKNVQ